MLKMGAHLGTLIKTLYKDRTERRENGLVLWPNFGPFGARLEPMWSPFESFRVACGFQYTMPGPTSPFTNRVLRGFETHRVSLQPQMVNGKGS